MQALANKFFKIKLLKFKRKKKTEASDKIPNNNVPCNK
jgi:hypothetical protein